MNEKRPLWAPWRINFINSKKDSQCFLCAKEQLKTMEEMQEKHVVAYGNYCYLLLNDFPYSSGHLMVASRQHVGKLEDLSKNERNEMMDFCVRAQQILTDVLKPDGFNVGFNIGVAAGAGVADHLHMHVVPRWFGDTNFMPVFADVRVMPEALEQTIKLLIDAYKKRFVN